MTGRKLGMTEEHYIIFVGHTIFCTVQRLIFRKLELVKVLVNRRKSLTLSGIRLFVKNANSHDQNDAKFCEAVERIHGNSF